MQGWGWQSVHDPITLPEVLERWKSSIATGKSFEMVFPLRGADGVFHPFLTRVMPVHDVDGEVVRWFGTNTDISEQKQVEAELRKSKARLDLAVEVASLGEWEFDFEQKTGSCSSRYAQVFGYPSQEQEWSFAKLLDHVLPQHRAEVEEKLQAAEVGGAWDFETQIRRADKAVCWIWVRGRCSLDQMGQPARVFGTVMDITVRKNTEEALREAHNKLQDVLNSITDGVLILDKDWHYTYCSEQGAKMIGMRPEDLIGKCVWELFPHAKGTKFYEAYHRAFEGGQAIHFEEFYPEPLNRWLECHCYPSSEALSVFFRDVTARKWMEEALFKEGALQRAIFDSANFSSIATDANGIIQIFNVGAERMLGYVATEVMNKITPADISDPQEVIERAKALSLELGTPIKPGFEALVFKASRGIEDIYELTYVRKDGSRFPAMVSVTALRDVQHAIIGYLLIGTDNSARKLAEEALFRAGALQRAIFNSANFSSIATDASGVIQIFNVGAERMLGYKAADVMNKITPADISDPQEVIARAKALSIELGTTIKPGFEALVFKASRGMEDIYELTYVRKDGSRFPAMVSVTALRDAQQSIIGYLLIGTDNSARKLAEEALFRAGALQRAIFDSANFSSIATDADGIIQIFNVGAERMLGYSAAEVMNKITPADISDPQEVVARAQALSHEIGTLIEPGFEALVFKASRGIEDIYELTYVRKDGSRFPAMVSVTALRDAQETILGYLLIGTDNSARKLAEEALYRAGALQRAIFDSANFSSIATDANGIIQIFNVGAERMLGYTAAEVMNKITPADISDPKEVVARAEALSRELGTPIKPGFDALVFKASRGIEDIYELTYVRKDGSRFPAMVSVTALRDAHETILGYLLIGTDNSARKRAEEALFKAGALQRAIFDSANFSSIATDANGIIQIFNVGAERMLGYTAADVMNKITPADISDPQEVIERAKALSRELGTEIKPGFEALVFKASRGIEDIYALTYVRKDGSRFPAMVSVTALRDAQKTILGYLLIGTDNTARKQVEEALIRSEKLASVGRMAATIAHEINNPLSSALNALYLVRTDPALPECVRSHLVLAEQELGRVAHITKQALGFFREVGSPTAVAVGDVFDSVLDIYGPRLRNKDVEVKRSYRSSTPIHAIDEEIRQVASNVIANSLDALSQGGKLHVRLFGPQALRGPRHMVRMTIADDGEGIAAENLKQICEPFFTTKQSVGTGLGLWVTSELVKKHEGRMRVKSQLGKGTVVTIWLPMERRAQDRSVA